MLNFKVADVIHKSYASITRASAKFSTDVSIHKSKDLEFKTLDKEPYSS